MLTKRTAAGAHFTNCLFYRNDADKNDSGTRGGAIYTNRKVVLLGCTFGKNWCGDNNRGGGVYAATGDSILRNCILCRNEAAGTHNQEGDQIRAENGVTLTVTDCCIEILTSNWDTSNTGSDPKYKNFNSDNYELDPVSCSDHSCTSQSIDQGEDDDCTGACDSGGDVFKRTRKVNLDDLPDDIDMGALETPSGS